MTSGGNRTPAIWSWGLSTRSHAPISTAGTHPFQYIMCSLHTTIKLKTKIKAFTWDLYWIKKTCICIRFEFNVYCIEEKIRGIMKQHAWVSSFIINLVLDKRRKGKGIHLSSNSSSSSSILVVVEWSKHLTPMAGDRCLRLTTLLRAYMWCVLSGGV